MIKLVNTLESILWTGFYLFFIIILSWVVIGVNIYMMTGMDYVNWREAGCYACKELE